MCDTLKLHYLFFSYISTSIVFFILSLISLTLPSTSSTSLVLQLRSGRAEPRTHRKATIIGAQEKSSGADGTPPPSSEGGVGPRLFLKPLTYTFHTIFFFSSASFLFIFYLFPFIYLSLVGAHFYCIFI
jgi:hypothetical protein